VVTPPAGFLAAVRESCTKHGALMILDEVQGAIGRTGYWLAHEHPDLGPVKPDVITFAKGLAGGLPIGAMVAVGDAAKVLQPGDHGTTFGGNPVCAAAALAVIETIEKEGLLQHVQEVGAHFIGRLQQVEHELVAQVRGLGLWIGVALTQPLSGMLEEQARAAGFLINAAVPDAIRIAPPLVVTSKEVDRFADELPHLLQTVLGRAKG
jgi:acetylornithine aminotransferase